MRKGLARSARTRFYRTVNVSNHSVPEIVRMGAISYKLTPREIEIICLIALGQTQKDAAVALGIELGTMHTHVENIRFKVKGNTMVDQVVKLLMAGLEHGEYTGPEGI